MAADHTIMKTKPCEPFDLEYNSSYYGHKYTSSEGTVALETKKQIGSKTLND